MKRRIDYKKGIKETVECIGKLLKESLERLVWSVFETVCGIILNITPLFFL